MLEQILQHLSVTKSSLALIVCVAIAYLYSRIHEARKIRALGHQAPVCVTYLPFGLDFVYSGIKHLMADRNLEFWIDNFATYGTPTSPYTVEVGIASGRAIVTADPENIKAILATQFADYGKGQVFNKEWHDFLGDGIFSTDGEKWHNSRQLIRPQFVKDRLSDLNTFERHVNVLLSLFGGQGQEVDVADLFLRYTLDAATDFLLGSSVNSLEDPGAKFAEAFGEVQRLQSIRTRMGPLGWLMPKKQFFAELKRVEGFIHPFIERTLTLSSDELEKRSKSDEGYTFLHALAGYTKDRKVLRDQIMAILLAGRDTTASTLAWLFYELSNRPHVVQKLRQEIIDVVGLQRPPTYADLKSMRYLQHTINETLRIYPVLPFNVRMALHDTTLPRGGGLDGNQPVGVLKDSPIIYSTMIMQRRPDLYPPELSGFPPILEFVPERWDHWTPKPWTYIPFNGGPRICVGQQFALTEIAYTVVRILQRFSRLESGMAGEAPGFKMDIILLPAKPLKVVFWEDNARKT